MAFNKTSILFAFALVLGGGLKLGAAEGELYEDADSEWPAGVSPLDSLSFWDEDDAVSSEDGANGCCLPKTWTGRLFTEVRREGGRPRARPRPEPKTLRFVQVVSVDQVNKRVAEDVIIPGRHRNATTISYILLFKNSSATLYTFSKAAKRCAKKELKGAQFRPMCLPANATLQASFALGAGSTILKTQSWGYLFRDRRAAVAGNIILSPGNCVPIIAGEKIFLRPKMSEDNEIEKKRPSVTSIGSLYTDIAAQIRDPSVFTPPSYCNKTEETLTFDPDVDVTEIIERYVTVP